MNLMRYFDESSSHKRLVFDIETNGFYYEVTKVHCIVVQDFDTREIYRFYGRSLREGVEFLSTADVLIAHNGVKYDLPVLNKLFPDIKLTAPVFDTMVAASVLFYNIRTTDLGRITTYNNSRGKKGLPAVLRGSHSLKAWGYRLGELKGTYAESTDWQEFSQDMLAYCQQDVVVTTRLLEAILKRYQSFSPDAVIQLEHDIARVIGQQERNGFRFNLAKAEDLLSELQVREVELRHALVDYYGSWYVPRGVVTPKSTASYKKDPMRNRTKDAPYTKVALVEFNPSSRRHIAKVLLEAGFKPTEFTPTGEPVINEETLEGLNLPNTELITEYLTVTKRLGQLATGNQAWLKAVKDDGYIYGSVMTNGAVTGRATHAYPNVAQVPACGKLYGTQCRELFYVPDDWYLLGTDAAGLELRALAHFLYPFDDGAYINVVLDGDVHTTNQHAAGLSERAQAKRFIYAFLYGAGDELIGGLVGYTEEEYLRWKQTGAHEPVIERLKAQGIPVTRDRVCKILKGKEVKARFLRKMPSVKKLIQACQAEAKEFGYLTALDGRRVPVAKLSAALNMQLQSAGAIICKRWVVRTCDIAVESGLTHGRGGDFMLCAWVHDEMQIACRTHEIAERIAGIAQQAMRETQEHFDFRCRLDTDYKIGRNWAETH
jgi:DNA polymerase I-like protein with 3'-5' exonuclease and polymerase domains